MSGASFKTATVYGCRYRTGGIPFGTVVGRSLERDPEPAGLLAAAGTFSDMTRVVLRKVLAAEWERLEVTLPNRPLTAPELDELVARWSAIVERVYSRSR